MPGILNDNVAEYYSRQSHSYIQAVRDKSAYRRAISKRELAFVLKHLKPGAKVLEIGCGPGFFTNELVKHAKSVLATDISRKMVDAVKENVPATNLSAATIDVYDLEKLPEYGSFDTVVCMRVLCHVEDASLGLAKIGGAIHKNGNVIFDLLNSHSYIHAARSILGRRLQHTKYHQVEAMRQMISQNGFHITDSFGRGYPYIGEWTLDSIGYRLFPALAHGVCYNVVPTN